MAPSPMIATTRRDLSATAIPKAAEMELLACPAVNVSYSDSAGVGNGARPPN